MGPLKAVSPTGSGNFKPYWFLLIRLFLWVKMKQERLNLYFLDMKYVRYLHNADDRVQSVSPQIHKNNRPFVGIIYHLVQKPNCSSMLKKHCNDFKKLEKVLEKLSDNKTKI